MDWILKYRDLQVGLWSCLVATCKDAVGEYLLAVPSRGMLTYGGLRWTFTKHGGGVMFTEEGGHRRVDLHDAAAGPERVDAWRLATYLGGLGREGEKLITLSVGPVNSAMEDRVQVFLDQLVEQGLMESDGTTYVFCLKQQVQDGR